MGNTDNIDKILNNSFLKEFSELEKKRLQDNQEHRDIAKIKKQQLMHVETFLQKFVDLDIYVRYCSQALTTHFEANQQNTPQKFEFYYADSSKKWSPGVSIFFDHPAQVEIAIPNNTEDDGIVVMHVISNHPYAYLLEQRFDSHNAVFEALAKFLAKCTIKINSPPKKHIKQMSESRNPMPLDDIPTTPPTSVVALKQKPHGKTVNSISAMQKINQLFGVNTTKS